MNHGLVVSGVRHALDVARSSRKNGKADHEVIQELLARIHAGKQAMQACEAESLTLAVQDGDVDAFDARQHSLWTDRCTMARLALEAHETFYADLSNDDRRVLTRSALLLIGAPAATWETVQATKLARQERAAERMARA